MVDDLDTLIETIDHLEEDEDTDTFPWCDAARWCPTEVAWDAPYDDPLPEFTDDGAVMVCDPLRPWVVVVYEPPWWAE